MFQLIRCDLRYNVLLFSVSEDFLSLGRPTIGLAQARRRTCVTIPIINDEIAEPNEMFRVVLERDAIMTERNVRISVPFTTIVVVDNDASKLISNAHQHHYCSPY